MAARPHSVGIAEQSLSISSPELDSLLVEQLPVARIQTLLGTLRSAKSNATEILSLLAQFLETVRVDIETVTDPRTNTSLQKSLHHGAQLVARFVNELNTRLLTLQTCEEICMIVLHIDSLRRKVVESISSPNPTQSDNLLPHKASRGTNRLARFPTGDSPILRKSNSSRRANKSSRLPKSLSLNKLEPRTATPVDPQILAFLPPSCEPSSTTSSLKNQIGFNQGELELSASQQVPVAFTLSIFEFDFSRSHKEPLDIYVRCDFSPQTLGPRQRCETTLYPQCLSKAMWSSGPFKFHTQVSPSTMVNITTNLTVSLRVMEGEKSKLMGQHIFTPVDLFTPFRGGIQIIRSSKQKSIGTLLVEIQPYPSLANLKNVPLEGVMLTDYPSTEYFSFAKLLKSAPLEWIAQHLLSEHFFDASFQSMALFFLTEYATLRDFLQAIQPLSNSLTPRIYSLLSTLLCDYFALFVFNPNGHQDLDTITSFVERPMTSSSEIEYKQISSLLTSCKSLINDYREGFSKLPANPKPDFEWIPSAFVKTPRSSELLSFLSLDPDCVAEQITLLESEIFRRIHIVEFLRWHHDDHAINSPALEYLTRHFNHFSSWIQTEISFQSRLETRAEVLKKAMKLCCSLARLHNYNGLMEILSAINSSAVSRMQRTFQAVDKQTLLRFQKVQAIMSHEGNYRKYRKIIATLPKGTSVVPYVGVFLTDLRFIMDGQPSHLTETLSGYSLDIINWQKFCKAAETLSLILRLQADSIYTQITPLVPLQLWIFDRKFATSNECYVMSRRVDPQDYEALVEEFTNNERLLKSRILELETKLGIQPLQMAQPTIQHSVSFSSTGIPTVEDEVNIEDIIAESAFTKMEISSLINLEAEPTDSQYHSEYSNIEELVSSIEPLDSVPLKDCFVSPIVEFTNQTESLAPMSIPVRPPRRNIPPQPLNQTVQL